MEDDRTRGNQSHAVKLKTHWRQHQIRHSFESLQSAACYVMQNYVSDLSVVAQIDDLPLIRKFTENRTPECINAFELQAIAQRYDPRCVIVHTLARLCDGVYVGRATSANPVRQTDIERLLELLSGFAALLEAKRVIQLTQQEQTEAAAYLIGYARELSESLRQFAAALVSAEAKSVVASHK